MCVFIRNLSYFDSVHLCNLLQFLFVFENFQLRRHLKEGILEKQRYGHYCDFFPFFTISRVHCEIRLLWIFAIHSLFKIFHSDIFSFVWKTFFSKLKLTNSILWLTRGKGRWTNLSILSTERENMKIDFYKVMARLKELSVENRTYNVITHYCNRPICRYVFPLFQKYIHVTKM